MAANSCSANTFIIFIFIFIFLFLFHFMLTFMYLLARNVDVLSLFPSDDTGCPSSQSVSPVKTPSDAGNSPISFCTGSDGDFCRKKFSPGTTSEGNPQPGQYKKETKTSLVKPGEYNIIPFISLITLSNLLVPLQVSTYVVLCCL